MVDDNYIERSCPYFDFDSRHHTTNENARQMINEHLRCTRVLVNRSANPYLHPRGFQLAYFEIPEQIRAFPESWTIPKSVQWRRGSLFSDGPTAREGSNLLQESWYGSQLHYLNTSPTFQSQLRQRAHYAPNNPALQPPVNVRATAEASFFFFCRTTLLSTYNSEWLHIDPYPWLRSASMIGQQR